MNDHIEVLRGLRERLVRINRDTDGDNHINESCDALDELDAALAAMGGQGEARESRMVVLRRKQDGTPSVWCDPEIADLVAALNAGGVPTIASCSGHGERPGNIALADGRELIIAKDYAEARAIESASVANPAPHQPEAGVGGEVSYAECCDTPAYCSSVRRCTAKDTPPPSAVPDGMIERIKAAEQRIIDGHAPRRIPADPTDVDLVLAEVRLFLEGKPAPFWLAAAPKPGEVDGG